MRSWSVSTSSSSSNSPVTQTDENENELETQFCDTTLEAVTQALFRKNINRLSILRMSLNIT